MSPWVQFQRHCRPWAARSNNLMKQQLLTFDFVFWYVTIICQMVACWALIRRKQFFQHWKVFGYYLFYSTGVAMFMLAMALFASNRAFATAYSILDFVEAIFLNLVLLEILVKADGSIGEMRLKKSSGSTRLDDAALRAVKNWHFLPAKRGGEAIDFQYELPIEFSLNH